MGPLVILHESTGQPATCLDSFVRYAREISKTPTAESLSEAEILAYLWASPVVFDMGEGPSVKGCKPAQRSRIWPADLNCWEATAHFVGWAIAQQLAIELHVFDANVGKIRHVFPAWRLIGSSQLPEALVLQPPVTDARKAERAMVPQLWGTAKPRAQAWYNDLFGAVHLVGQKALDAYGVGFLGDVISDASGEDLPDWARTKSQMASKKESKAEEKKAEAEKKAPQIKQAPRWGPPPPPSPAPPSAPANGLSSIWPLVF